MDMQKQAKQDVFVNFGYVSISKNTMNLIMKKKVPSSTITKIGMFLQEIESVSSDGTLIKVETTKDITSQISKGLAATVP